MGRPRPAFYQGLYDFPDFSTYRREWLVPQTLGDLETIFKGSTMYWAQDRTRSRGNFVLATALFAVMDHVGSFLQPPDGSESTWRNISATALQLPSLKRVHTLIAHCGRNALIHAAWPQTMLVFQDGAKTLRLGLNISAEEDASRDHSLFYWRTYAEPEDDSGKEQAVLKLRLNVYALLQELGACLRGDALAVDHRTFERVRRRAAEDCYFTVHGSGVVPRSRDNREGKSERAVQLLAEIRMLFQEAPPMGQTGILQSL